MINLKTISFYLAVVAGFAAGVASIVAAVLFKQPAFGVWAGVFIIGAAICAFTAKEGTPGGSFDPSVSATYKQVPDGATYVLFGLVILGIVLTIVLKVVVH